MNIIARNYPDCVEPMVMAAIPSTFVRALYLFFDTPPSTPAPVTTAISNSTARFQDHDPALLGQAFTSLLLWVAPHCLAMDELLRMDDLARLFDMLCITPEVHNDMWHRAVVVVLNAIVRTGLTDKAITYLHKKGVVAKTLSSLNHVERMQPQNVGHIVSIVINCVVESRKINPLLLSDLRRVCAFLTDIMLKLESLWVAAADITLLCSLVRDIASLIFPPSESAAFGQIPKYTPVPNSAPVHNGMAFLVLHNIFLSAKAESICGTILDIIEELLYRDGLFYAILEENRSLALFIERIETLPRNLQEKVFKLLGHVVCTLNVTPYPGT